MADETCGKPYTINTPVGPVGANCLRDKGHDEPGYKAVFWPPSKTEEEELDRQEGYRVCGYEDRTPY